MMEKPLYDSWKSEMELYMQNREHRRMILESVEHGPLIWPTIEEDCVISRQLISFFKDYHLMSIHSLIIIEFPRIYEKEFNYYCKVVEQKFKEYDQKLEAFTLINVSEAIKEAV
nr:hypothetical protein [Tanacetum cinerariifolium]